ncbi:MAG: hypothetical protein PVJ47_05040 [Thiohalocapsa sp.]|jgi:hypothetical protein
MLETLAIAALVMGGVSTAAVVTDDQSVADADRNKPAVVEVQNQEQSKAQESGASKNPFLD